MSGGTFGAMNIGLTLFDSTLGAKNIGLTLFDGTFGASGRASSTRTTTRNSEVKDLQKLWVSIHSELLDPPPLCHFCANPK